MMSYDNWPDFICLGFITNSEWFTGGSMEHTWGAKEYYLFYKNLKDIKPFKSKFYLQINIFNNERSNEFLFDILN